MIETRIMKSDSGLGNRFELQFNYSEYYPVEDELSDRWSCYEYFLWLFNKHALILGDPKGQGKYFPNLWECVIDNIPFSMCYSEDDDWMTFSVSEDHIKDIPAIANKIKELIVKEAGIEE